MSDLMLVGGTVLTPAGPVERDVRISGATVIEVGSDLSSDDAVVIDAAGCWVGPGLVDLHTHLREPGQEWKEDIATGSAAAAAGGFTAVVAMPNTEPPVDSGHVAGFVSQRGRSCGLVEVIPSGCVSLGRGGERLAHLDELWAAGVRLFSDDGSPLDDSGLLRRAMEYLAELGSAEGGAVLAQHAEDPGLSRNGHVHEGAVSSRLGMGGIPALAEELMVSRDLALVALTGCRYHVQHVSTTGTVALMRQAKADGLPVTAEVTPHHLVFDHGEVLSMDPRFKMYPPLRSPADVESLRAALVDGTIDAVATDHAPHAAHETEVPFEEAPRGVIGLETAVAGVLTAVELGQTALFDRMSIAPARIAGMPRQGRPVEPGAPANVVVIDPEAVWTVTGFVSKAQNSPFLGRELKGRVVATIHEGALTHQAERASK